MTNTTASTAALVARVLLAFMFILAGWGKLGDIQGTMAYTASGGLPGFFALPAIAIEILGGIAVLIGWQTRWAALALAGFAVLAGSSSTTSRRRASKAMTAWGRSSASRRTWPSPAASCSSPPSAPAGTRSTSGAVSGWPSPEPFRLSSASTPVHRGRRPRMPGSKREAGRGLRWLHAYGTDMESVWNPYGP